MNSSSVELLVLLETKLKSIPRVFYAKFVPLRWWMRFVCHPKAPLVEFGWLGILRKLKFCNLRLIISRFLFVVVEEVQRRNGWSLVFMVHVWQI